MKLKSIKKICASRVINLTVHGNHTFITANGIVTHNCDNISRDAQMAYRGFCDEYSQNCRFIFTGNYKEKIIQPLLDRLEVYDFESFSREEMIKPIFNRLKFVLDNEKIEYDPKDLVPVINTFYPRIRSMIGSLQKYSSDGIFKVDASQLDDLNVFDEVMKMHTPSTYNELVLSVNELNAPDNMYSFLYKNAGKYFSESNCPNVVVTIAKYQAWSDGVRDKNLNLAACLTELLKLK